MNLYNKIICLETYSHLLAGQGRKYEAEGYFLQAQKLKGVIPEWNQRKESLQIFDYQF
jgi:hypothetical protein